MGSLHTHRHTYICVHFKIYILTVRLFCNNFDLTSSASIIPAGLIKTICCGFSRLTIYSKFLALCKNAFSFAHNEIQVLTIAFHERKKKMKILTCSSICCVLKRIFFSQLQCYEFYFKWLGQDSVLCSTKTWLETLIQYHI